MNKYLCEYTATSYAWKRIEKYIFKIVELFNLLQWGRACLEQALQLLQEQSLAWISALPNTDLITQFKRSSVQKKGWEYSEEANTDCTQLWGGTDYKVILFLKQVRLTLLSRTHHFWYHGPKNRERHDSEEERQPNCERKR